MPNTNVNKVIYGDTTLIDLTSDTVAAASMLGGVTAHDASGATITGTIPTKTSSNINYGWNNQGKLYIEIPAGYYASTIQDVISTIAISAPTSGTRTFSVKVPNGEEHEYITIDFEVDSNGNSNITEDVAAANGVSF